MTCGSCQHWAKNGVAVDTRGNALNGGTINQGMCQQQPPQVIYAVANFSGEATPFVQTIWPETSEYQICGQYRERKIGNNFAEMLKNMKPSKPKSLRRMFAEWLLYKEGTRK